MKGDSKGRLEAALAVCQELQFSKALIIRTVRNLLNVYGSEGGWSYIEENRYANLVECIMAERNGRRENKMKAHGVKSIPHAGASRPVPPIPKATRDLDSIRSGRDAVQQQMSQSSPHDEDCSEGSPRYYQESPDSPDIQRHQRRLWTLQVGLPLLSCFEDLGPVHAPEAYGVEQLIMTSSNGEEAVKATDSSAAEQPEETQLSAKNASEKLKKSSHIKENAVHKVCKQSEGKRVASSDIVPRVEKPEGGALGGDKECREKPKTSSQVSLVDLRESINPTHGNAPARDEEHSMMVSSGERQIDVCSGTEAPIDFLLAIEQTNENSLGSTHSLLQEDLQGSPKPQKGKRGLHFKGGRTRNLALNVEVIGGDDTACDREGSSPAAELGEEVQDSQVGLHRVHNDSVELMKIKDETVKVPEPTEATVTLHGQVSEVLAQNESAGNQTDVVKLTRKPDSEKNSGTLVESTSLATGDTRKGSEIAERSPVKVTSNVLSMQRDGKSLKRTSDGASHARGRKPIAQVAGIKVPKNYGGKLLSKDSDERRKSPCKLPAASADHIEIPKDSTVSKGLDVGRTAAFKLGGQKGCSSLLQKQKSKKTFGFYEPFESTSPRGQWKHDVCTSRASPLVSPTSGPNIKTKVKIPGFGRSLSNNDRRPIDHGASVAETVAEPVNSSSKSRVEATKVPVPSAASGDSELQPTQLPIPGIHGNSTRVDGGSKAFPTRMLPGMDKRYITHDCPPLNASNRDAASTPDLPPGFGNWASFTKIKSPTRNDHKIECYDTKRCVLHTQEEGQKIDISYNARQTLTLSADPGSLSRFSDQLKNRGVQGDPDMLPVSRCELTDTSGGTHLTPMIMRSQADVGAQQPVDASNFVEQPPSWGRDRGPNMPLAGTLEIDETCQEFSSNSVPPDVEFAPPMGSTIPTDPPGATPQVPVNGVFPQPQYPLFVQPPTMDHQFPPGVRPLCLQGGIQPSSPSPAVIPAAGMTLQALPIRQVFIPSDASSSPRPQSYPPRPAGLPSMPAGPRPPLPPWPPAGATRHVGQHSYAPPLPSGPLPPSSFIPGPYGPPFRPSPSHASMNMAQQFPGARMGQPPLPLGPPPTQMYPPGMEPPCPSPSGAPTTVRPFSSVSPQGPPPSWGGKVPNTAAGNEVADGADQRRDAREHAKSLFVGNIPAGSPNTVAVLQEVLEEYLKPLECVPAKSAKIERVSLYERSIGSYAFIQFPSEAITRIILDACQEKSARIQLQGVQLTVGRNLKAATAASTSRERMFRGNRHLEPAKILYMGNLPDQWRNESLIKHFSEALGGSGADPRFVSGIFLLPDCTDVYVEFSSEAMADAMVYKCIKDPSFLQNMGENIFFCRHPKFVPLFATATDPPAATPVGGAHLKPEMEKPSIKEAKTDALDQWVSRRQSTLYVGNLPLTAEAYSVQHLWELFDGILSRTPAKETATGCVKSVTWPPGRHYAHVEFDTEATADSVMDAYIEQTPDFCLNDMALSVFRHQKYLRPGAIYKSTGGPGGVTKPGKSEEKSAMKIADLTEQPETEDGDEGSYDESGQVVHSEELLHGGILASSNPVLAGPEDVRGSPDIGSSGGWNDNLYKTKLCSKFIHGDCPFGDRCRYAHGVEEIRQPLPLTDAAGARIPVLLPCQSATSQSSSTGGTSETAGGRFAETAEANDEFVDAKSVICIRGIADGIMTHSLKGVLNELFERALLTAGVLETGKHVVRYSQLKDNSKQALVTLISVHAASAILAVSAPLRLAGQPLLILPWSHMQQQLKPRQAAKLPSVPAADLQWSSSLGDSPEVVNASPAAAAADSKPPGRTPPTPAWIFCNPWPSQTLPNPECVPHSGALCPPGSAGMSTTRPYLPPHFHPDFGRPLLQCGGSVGFGSPGGFRSPVPHSSPWQPSRQQHMTWPASTYPPSAEGWPTRSWVEPPAQHQGGLFGWRPMHGNEGIMLQQGPHQPGVMILPMASTRPDGGSDGGGQEVEPKTGGGDTVNAVHIVTTGGWLEYEDATNHGLRTVTGTGEEGGSEMLRAEAASVGVALEEPPKEDGSTQALEAPGLWEIQKAMSDVSRCEKEDSDMKISVSDPEASCSRELLSSRDSHGQLENADDSQRDGKRKREFEVLECTKLAKVGIDEKMTSVTDPEPNPAGSHRHRRDGDGGGDEGTAAACGEKRRRESPPTGHDFRNSMNCHTHNSRGFSAHRDLARCRGSSSHERDMRRPFSDDRSSSRERRAAAGWRSECGERVSRQERGSRYMSSKSSNRPIRMPQSSPPPSQPPAEDDLFRRNGRTTSREREPRHERAHRTDQAISGGGVAAERGKSRESAKEYHPTTKLPRVSSRDRESDHRLSRRRDHAAVSSRGTIHDHQAAVSSRGTRHGDQAAAPSHHRDRDNAGTIYKSHHHRRRTSIPAGRDAANQEHGSSSHILRTTSRQPDATIRGSRSGGHVSAEKKQQLQHRQGHTDDEDQSSHFYDPMKPSSDWKCSSSSRDGSSAPAAANRCSNRRSWDVAVEPRGTEKPGERPDRLFLRNREVVDPAASRQETKSARGALDDRPRASRRLN